MFTLVTVLNILSILLGVIAIASLIALYAEDSSHGVIIHTNSKTHRILERIIRICAIGSLVIVLVDIAICFIEFDYKR